MASQASSPVTTSTACAQSAGRTTGCAARANMAPTGSGSVATTSPRIWCTLTAAMCGRSATTASTPWRTALSWGVVPEGGTGGSGGQRSYEHADLCNIERLIVDVKACAKSSLVKWTVFCDIAYICTHAHTCMFDICRVLGSGNGGRDRRRKEVVDRVVNTLTHEAPKD